MGSKDLVAASAKAIILSLLLAGESYGYQIIKRVRRVSGGEVEWSNAVLYPVLHKMERDGLIRSEWRVTENQRRARYYSLTRQGRRQVSLEVARWERMSRAINLVLEATLGRGGA